MHVGIKEQLWGASSLLHSAVESGDQGLDLGDQASTLSAERSQWPSSQCEVRSLSILSARLLFLYLELSRAATLRWEKEAGHTATTNQTEIYSGEGTMGSSQVCHCHTRVTHSSQSTFTSISSFAPQVNT